eukprot:s2726_g13.t1
MHETGLVFLPSFEDVGEEESQRQYAKVGNATQIKRIAKAVYRMSLVMGLEPLGAMGQATCAASETDGSNFNKLWIFAWITVFSLVAWRLRKRVSILEMFVHGMERDVFHAQQQLADHYDYAARLDERLDTMGETNEGLSARMAVFEEETMETLGELEESINGVRYGLMEYGGFVRNDSLS